MAASGVFVTALAGGAAGRVAPLCGELTLSFLNRLAARYHLGLRDLLAAITETDGRQNVAGMLYPDSEIHLNARHASGCASSAAFPRRCWNELCRRGRGQNHTRITQAARPAA